MYTKSAADVETYTNAYHRMIPTYKPPHPIHTYFEGQYFDILHTTFDLLQREQIAKSYHNLLETFSQLPTETEKKDFAQQHATFLNLARSLQKNQKKFDTFLGQYLYLKQKETLGNRMIHQWRLQMIRLFATEGLDDFEYRHALVTGALRPILAKDKLCSPIKIAVAILNSIILAITTTLNYILSLHFLLRIGFFFLLIHPVAMLMVQLPRIAQILEMMACPINQIIRPLCTYTHWSPQIITLLLILTSLVTLYGMLYTAMLTYMSALLPYIALGIFAYILYSMGKQCMALFKESFVAGMSFILTITTIFSIRAYMGHLFNAGQHQSDIKHTKQWLSMFGLFSMATLLTTEQQRANISLEMLPLPLPEEASLSQTIYDVPQIHTTNLSHRFFNTAKNARPRHKHDIEQHHHPVLSCFACQPTN
ncbi:MAG: hypothetical protein NXI01_05435 [Gammaproteobacteria bacterium]|nr:hypothetical protein [Gammaproteobacteria bacterium]